MTGGRVSKNETILTNGPGLSISVYPKIDEKWVKSVKIADKW